MTDRFEKFTERSRKVFSLAQEEAKLFNHNYIGTEHLLLGLIRERDGIAARVLANLGVDLSKVRSAVVFIIGRGDGLVVGEPGLTPRAKKVIELAMDEARRLNNHYIGTEHLLLGLVREGEGIAAGVLESHGVALEAVPQGVMQVVAPSSSYRTAGSATPAAALATMQEEMTTKPVLPVLRIQPGQMVYGLTIPATMMASLMRIAQDTDRSLDDLIAEAITQTWLQEGSVPATDTPDVERSEPPHGTPEPPDAG